MVGIKSGHLTEEEKKTVLPHRSLYIDLGLRVLRGGEDGDCNRRRSLSTFLERWTIRITAAAAMTTAACSLCCLLKNSRMGISPNVLGCGYCPRRAAPRAHFTRPDWFMALDVAVSMDTPEAHQQQTGAWVADVIDG
jgi:hypothetical protein